MGILLFENIRNFDHIVKSHVGDIERRIPLQNQLKAVSNFLKHGNETHLEADETAVQNTRVALIVN